jgi:hypothetical protein
MDLLTTLGRTLGFSFAAGINLYATVAILGLAQRYGWVTLPDKIPWVDSIWDAVHTVIRPVGGALIAVAALGDATPAVKGLIALLGGTVAAGSHLTKAGTRAAANTSPEPFSNWILSLTEDAFVIGLSALALKYPVAAAIVVIVALILIATFAAWIVRAVRRRWATPAVSPRL